MSVCHTEPKGMIVFQCVDTTLYGVGTFCVRCNNNTTQLQLTNISYHKYNIVQCYVLFENL